MHVKCVAQVKPYKRNKFHTGLSFFSTLTQSTHFFKSSIVNMSMHMHIDNFVWNKSESFEFNMSRLLTFPLQPGQDSVPDQRHFEQAEYIQHLNRQHLMMSRLIQFLQSSGQDVTTDVVPDQRHFEQAEYLQQLSQLYRQQVQHNGQGNVRRSPRQAAPRQFLQIVHGSSSYPSWEREVHSK